MLMFCSLVALLLCCSRFSKFREWCLNLGLETGTLGTPDNNSNEQQRAVVESTPAPPTLSAKKRTRFVRLFFAKSDRLELSNKINDLGLVAHRLHGI